MVYLPPNHDFLESSMTPFLKDNYDIKYTFGTYSGTTYYGCKLYDTNEYLDLTLVSSYGQLNHIIGKTQKTDTYFLEIDSLNKYEFDKYLEIIKDVIVSIDRPKLYKASKNKKEIDSFAFEYFKKISLN